MTVQAGLEPPGPPPNQSSQLAVTQTRTDSYLLSVNKHKRPRLPNAFSFWNRFDLNAGERQTARALG